MAVEHCIPCYLEDKLRTTAIVVIDDEPLCAKHRDVYGYAAHEGRQLGQAPTPAPKGTTPMKTPETCACGCGGKLSEQAIGQGWRYLRGHKTQQQMVQGTEPVKKPAKAESAHVEEPEVAEVATIEVTSVHLDRFWAGRSLTEKADMFSQFLARP